MKRISALTATLAATLATLSAHAAVVNASFTGLVQSQSNTAFAVDAPISGSFSYDTTTATYLSFVVGGQSVAAGFMSTAALSPDLYTALYTAQLSPLQSATAVNSTFSLDLEGNSQWSATNAIGLLSDSAQLASNLDLPDSSFRYYMANADGSAVHAVVAQLTGVNVIGAVPEPSNVALLALGLVPIFLLRGKRRG